jgi:hypothetical protein
MSYNKISVQQNILIFIISLNNGMQSIKVAF